MNDEFGKKIAAILNESPLEKRIEDRLAQARKIAISRSKNKENFIEIDTTPSGAIQLKSKLSQFQDQFKWLIWLSIGIMFIVLQQGVMNSNEESEPAQYLSNDYIQYKDKLDNEHESFKSWKSEVSNLIESDQQN